MLNLSFLFSRSFYDSLFALFIQQFIVATSTIWLTHLIVGIQEQNFQYYWLVLYLLSLLLPYFLGCFALTKLAEAKEKAIYNYVDLFRARFLGKIYQWNSAAQKRKTLSTLSQEAPHSIREYLNFIYELFSTGLNVLLNLAVVALIVEPYLFASYLIGLLMAVIVLKLQNKKRKSVGLKAQQSRTNWKMSC